MRSLSPATSCEGIEIWNIFDISRNPGSSMTCRSCGAFHYLTNNDLIVILGWCSWRWWHQYMLWCHFHPASNSSLEDHFKKLLIYFKFTYYIIKPLLLAYTIEVETRCLKKCNPKNCIKYPKAVSSGRKFS